MERELFGDGGAKGKLEYRRRASGAFVTLRFEVTKYRIHSPIGFCEGVCTAADVELWNQPEFLQTIIWGPDKTARGGVHLLVVKESGKSYLLLPGINPSLSLSSKRRVPISSTTR